MPEMTYDGLYHAFQARKNGVYRRYRLPVGSERRWRRLEPEVLNCFVGADLAAAQQANAEYEQKYLRRADAAR